MESKRSNADPRRTERHPNRVNSGASLSVADPRRNPGQTRKRRVVHVLTVPLSLRFLRGQAGLLRDAGYEMHVVCGPGEMVGQFAAEEQVQCHTLPFTRSIEPLSDFLNLIALSRLLRQLRPTIVHAHTPKGGLLGTLGALLAGAPICFYHMRGLPFETAARQRRRLLMLTERISCAAADEVLAVSPSLRRVALRHRLVSPAKIRVLNSGSGNGVDALRFDRTRIGAAAPAEIRRRLGIPESCPIVGFVGRIAQDKGAQLLLESWSLLRAERSDVHLLIVGSVDEADPPSLDLLGQIADDPRIHHVEFTETVEFYLAAMQLLAFPSRREGFPNVILEAAALGIPAVALRVTGSVDAVVHQHTGTLVDKDDTRAFTAALTRYLESPSLLHEHGRHACDWTRCRP